MIMEDMKRTIGELEQESSLPAVGVELVDNELATLYMNSKKSEVNTIHTLLWLTSACSLTDGLYVFMYIPVFPLTLGFTPCTG